MNEIHRTSRNRGVNSVIKPQLSPLFITGMSRSGTSLMSAIINTTSVYQIAPETHYFDDLRPRLGADATEFTSSHNRMLCESYFGKRIAGYYGTKVADRLNEPVESVGTVTNDAVTERASEIGSGGDSYFEAFCQLHAELKGKPQWGEKTPRHTFRIREILERYPSSKILVMIRDPRAVAASYSRFHIVRSKAGYANDRLSAHTQEDARRVRRSFHPVTQALMWKSAIKIARRAVEQHGSDRVRLLRYEDLVSNANEMVDGLSHWLGIDKAEFRLQEVPHMNSADVAVATDRGITNQSLDNWRRSLSRGQIAAVQSCAGRLMVEMGYSLEPIPWHAVRASRAWAGLPVAVARGLIANRYRIGNPWQYVYRRAFGR